MRVRLFAALVPLALAAAPVQAQFTPTYDTFGALPQATFGGSGIPNHAVAQSVFNGVTLGLTATQRFSNPVVTNNGAGTYYATLGSGGSGATAAYARWNFNYFIGGQNAGNYSYVLRYDFDPAQGTLVADHGSVALGNAASQNSWNLGMGFLNSTGGPIVEPTYASFSNSVNGEYTFALLAYDANNVEVDRVAIAVTTTPEPASLTLMASGLLAFGLAARRRRKA